MTTRDKAANPHVTHAEMLHRVMGVYLLISRTITNTRPSIKSECEESSMNQDDLSFFDHVAMPFSNEGCLHLHWSTRVSGVPTVIEARRNWRMQMSRLPAAPEARHDKDPAPYNLALTEFEIDVFLGDSDDPERVGLNVEYNAITDKWRTYATNFDSNDSSLGEDFKAIKASWERLVTELELPTLTEELDFESPALEPHRNQKRARRAIEAGIHWYASLRQAIHPEPETAA